MTEAQIVAIYIALRDRRAARKAAFSKEDETDKEAQEKCEAALLKRMHAQGVTSLSIAGVGTAYTTNRTSATVVDKEVFRQFVIDRNEWELLDVRASKTNVEAYREHYGEIPPGLNYSAEIAVNVRRAS